MANQFDILQQATEPMGIAGEKKSDGGVSIPPMQPINYQQLKDTTHQLESIVPAEIAVSMERLGINRLDKVIPGDTAFALDNLRVKGYDVLNPTPPVIPGELAYMLASHYVPPQKPVAPPITEEDIKKHEEGLFSRTMRGISYVPTQAKASVLDVLSFPVYMGGIAEGMISGETDGGWQTAAKMLMKQQAAIRQPIMAGRDPEQGLLSKAMDPSIIIPTAVDFGVQMLSMLGIGGVGRATAGKYISNTVAKEALGVAAGAVYGGQVEGAHTYYEALDRGFSQSEAFKAYAVHASLSTALSIPEVAFGLSKLPGPLQQTLFRAVVSGSTDAVSESLDEVASAYALGDVENFRQGLNVFANALSEIGPASMIVGMAAGGIAAPPTKEQVDPKAPTASQVEAELVGSLTGSPEASAFRGFAEDKIAHLLNAEADYFVANGQTYSTKNGTYKGAVVDGDGGKFWISGQHAQDGIAIPIENIVEVGKYDDNGLTVPLVTSETMRAVYAKAEEIETTRWGEDNGFGKKSQSSAEEYEAEVQRIARNAARERRARAERLRTAEFERNVSGAPEAKLEDVRRRRPQVGDTIVGLEKAVKEGIDSGAENIPENIPARTSDQLIKSIMDLEALRGSKKKPESADEAQQTKRRAAGLEGNVTRVQKQVGKNLGPSDIGSVSETVEQGAAKLALGEEIPTMEELMAAEEVVRRMNDRRKANDTVVSDDRGAKHTLDTPIISPIKQSAAETVSAGERTDFQGKYLSDAQAAVLRYAGSEEVMGNLVNGSISPEDLMMKQFRDDGLLEFVPSEGKEKYVVVRPEGVSDLDYQGALSAFVTNVRRLKSMLYYMHEGLALAKEEGSTIKVTTKKPGRASVVTEQKTVTKVPADNVTLASFEKPTKAQTGGNVLYSKGKVGRRVAKDRTEVAAGFAAAMRHTTMYHSLLRTGQTLGWMNPFSAAEAGSEMVYAMAQAWSSQTGKAPADFYSEYLGNVEAHAVAMTQSQIDAFDAVQGFAIPGEMLFSSRPAGGWEQQVYDIDMKIRQLKDQRANAQDVGFRAVKKLRGAQTNEVVGRGGDQTAAIKENADLNWQMTVRQSRLMEQIDDLYKQKMYLIAANDPKATFTAADIDGERVRGINTPYSVEGLRQAFGLTDAEAKATDLIMQAMQLDLNGVIDTGILELHTGLYGLHSLPGYIQSVSLGKSLVQGTEHGDVSTALHELAHAVRLQMFRREVLSKKEINYAKDWAKSANPLGDSNWGEPAEERFAEAFVSYIIHDKSTSPQLDKIFEKMRRWIREGDNRSTDRELPYAEQHVPEAKKTFNALLKRGKLYSRGNREIYGTYDPYTHNIQFFLGSDLNTVVHEFSHAFRQALPESAVKSLEKFIYQGRKRPRADEAWDVKAEEKFADSFEAWAAGRPTGMPKDVQQTFDKVGAYLTELYATGRALKPATKVNPRLADVMERLITKQLHASSDPDDREEAKARERVRREFLGSKPLLNLGDHMEATAEFLGIDKSKISRVGDLQKEANERRARRGYLKELQDKLAATEGSGIYAIDIVDFLIVRDEAIKIKQQFETEFRDAYNKGPAAVNELARKWQRRKAYVDIKNYIGVAGDAGRRLNLLRNEATKVDHALILDEAQKKYGAKGFEILYQMLNDPDNAHKIADKKAKEQAPGLMDLFAQLRYASLLASPTTHHINFVSTGLWTAWNYAVHNPITSVVNRTLFTMKNIPKVGKLVDKFYYPGNTEARDTLNTQLMPYLAQLSHSVPHGFKVGYRTLRRPLEGLHEFDNIKGLDIMPKDISSWQHYTLFKDSPLAKSFTAALGEKAGEKARQNFETTIRTLGPAVALPTNLMRASDLIFKTIAAEGQINRLVQLDAQAKFPHDTAAQKEYIAETTRKYADKLELLPESWQQEIIDAAAYNTFTDLPGPIGRHLLAAREVTPLAKFTSLMVMPFFNTLVNIGKRGLEMTPGVGLLAEGAHTLDPQYRAGQYGHRPADIIAKQIEGSIIAAMIFALLDDDKLTAEAPEDPTEKALFYNSGKRPYSIRFGDNWVSYEKVDPFSVPLRILANLKRYVWDNRGNFDDPSPEMQERVTRDLTTAGWAIGSIGLNVGFMRTFEDLIKAETTEQKLKAAGGIAESAVVPYSSLMRWWQRTSQMYQNEDGVFVPQQQLGIVDKALPLTHNMINRIFDLPETDLPRLTVWGEPYTYSDNKWYEVWWPAYYSEASTDPVDVEFERLQYAVGFPDKKYTRGHQQYEYSPEVWQQMVLGFGAESKPRLAQMIATDGYKALPDHLKFKRLSSIVDSVRKKQRSIAQREQRKLGERLVR